MIYAKFDRDLRYVTFYGVNRDFRELEAGLIHAANRKPAFHFSVCIYPELDELSLHTRLPGTSESGVNDEILKILATHGFIPASETFFYKHPKTNLK